MSKDKATFLHKKSLGQHFLNSDIVPTWLVEAAAITPGETVLEIGPGTGALTKALLAAGAQVIALEADERALTILTETYAQEIAQHQLILHHTDVRQLDFKAYNLTDHGFKVVANIPYYLSGHLFRSCLESNIQPTTLVFLVQKEVAKRICVSRERGEKESILSLSVKVYGTPIYVRSVGRGHFTPPPQVDSAIIAIHTINRSWTNQVPERFFFDLLHQGLGQKRKQLFGNLARTYTRDILQSIFNDLGIPETVRGEDLSLDTWLQLAHRLQQHTS
jgi:16S rRNA (adenine1518-N6/adenine1519-N6)-dimethyltransferase